MEILINSTSIGNIIITAGSVILLLVLIKLFAWEHAGVAVKIIAGQDVGTGQPTQTEQGTDGTEGVRHTGGIKDNEADCDQQQNIEMLQESCLGQSFAVPELFHICRKSLLHQP